MLRPLPLTVLQPLLRQLEPQRHVGGAGPGRTEDGDAGFGAARAEDAHARRIDAPLAGPLPHDPERALRILTSISEGKAQFNFLPECTSST